MTNGDETEVVPGDRDPRVRGRVGPRCVPGLATVALIAASVACFAVAGAGVRGALALALGALAIEGMVLALLDARNVGPCGDDWTGFLLAPAGVVLLATGVCVLWRARRGGRYRHLRRAGFAVLAVVSACWLVAPLAMAIAATHRPRQAVSAVDLGRPNEPVTLKTRDGLRLAAWYVRSGNGAAVISYPTRAGKLPQVRMLIRRGYGVLLLDARGYDASDGSPNLLGWGETKDIDAAIDWLRRQPDVHDGRIGGIGFSVGGEVMLEAAAGNPGLRAVVSEGAGIRSVREELVYGARAIPTLPAQLVQTTAVAILSGTLPPPSLRDLVPRLAPRPLFLIHAEHGGGGEDLNPSYYRAAGRPKQLWKVRGACHTGGIEADPHAYEARVVRFLDQSLLGKEQP